MLALLSGSSHAHQYPLPHGTLYVLGPDSTPNDLPPAVCAALMAAAPAPGSTQDEKKAIEQANAVIVARACPALSSSPGQKA